MYVSATVVSTTRLSRVPLPLRTVLLNEKFLYLNSGTSALTSNRFSFELILPLTVLELKPARFGLITFMYSSTFFVVMTKLKFSFCNLNLEGLIYAGKYRLRNV